MRVRKHLSWCVTAMRPSPKSERVLRDDFGSPPASHGMKTARCGDLQLRANNGNHEQLAVEVPWVHAARDVAASHHLLLACLLVDDTILSLTKTET